MNLDKLWWSPELLRIRIILIFPPVSRVRPIDKPPVRLGIFPEEWFQAFYSKTGVTGPYMALVSVGTFLMSKEYFVVEHDFFVGVALAIVLTGEQGCRLY
jgi:hypothetical protein